MFADNELAIGLRHAALAAAFPEASMCFDGIARGQIALDEAVCIDKMRGIYVEALARLTTELRKPQYAGKTGEEIQALLLTETFTEVDGVRVSAAPAPMSHLWNRLPGMANCPTLSDIDKARP